jgi:hypothetical protein
VNLRLHNPTHIGSSKATGQIQNREDFFEPGIAEVPTLFCVKTGFEFGALVVGGILAMRELPAAPSATFGESRPRGRFSPRIDLHHKPAWAGIRRSD